jgi:hypothetical protein
MLYFTPSFTHALCFIVSHLVACMCYSEEADAADVEVEVDAAATESSPEELWDVAHDDAGTPYFVNRETSESVWEMPEGFRYS